MESQILIIILTIGVANLITRFLPYFIFPPKTKIPNSLNYLSSVLPSAIIAMLVVYCLKDIDFSFSIYGFREIISIMAILVLHLSFKISIISVIGGVLVYMTLTQNFNF